jgi:hypothetical protein
MGFGFKDIVGLASLVFIFPSLSNADSWCVAKNGSVTVRPSCKKNQTTLNPASMGLIGP